MALLKIGSTGDEVKKLQKALGITADGVYGPQTEAAVKTYQQKNGLAVDGIVGSQTTGSLYKTAAAPTPSPAPTQTTNITGLTGLRDYGTGKGLNIDWSKDTGVTVNGQTVDTSGLVNKDNRLYGTLDQLNNIFSPFLTDTEKGVVKDNGIEGTMPYKSPFENKLQTALDNVLNFKVNPYDVNSDPSYASYKGQYTKAGDEAFKNAIGNLTALTGGRLNTWATSSATQAQNKYMQDLNNIIPELEQAYYNRQQNTFENLANQLKILQGVDDTSYGRYRDTVSDQRYDTEKQQSLTDKTKQEWIGNMGQFYENIQAEINKVQNDGDPSNDWQIPYLKNFRTQKIATMDSTSKANQEKAKASAMDLWEILGTATPEIAKILGVPVGAKTAAYQNMLADNARARSSGGSGGDDGGKPPLTNTQYLNAAKNTLANTIEVKNYKGEIEKVPNMTRHDFEVWLANLIPDDELFDAVYAALNLDAVRFKDEVATSKTGSSTKPKEGYVLINGVWEPSGFNITK